MIGEEIFKEIDLTLEQLISNAEAIQNVPPSELSDTELDAFQKTQESLLQHFLYMDECLAKKNKTLKTPNPKSARNQIQEKLYQFERLQEKYQKQLQASLNKKSDLLSKRRHKKVLHLTRL